MTDKNIKFNSLVIHGGQSPDKAYGAVMPPIYQTSTYRQQEPGNHKGYEYSRSHNPTRTALENSIASLENATYGMAFASGMAAIDTVLRVFNAGDHILIGDDLYGGSFRLVDKVLTRFGISYTIADMRNIDDIKSKIASNTKLIWLETPTNPMIRIADIAKVATIAKSNNILLAVDNTFATPYLQQPLLLGADIVVHSATKYLAGHSDVVLGLLAVNDSDLYQQLAFIQNSCGGVAGPMDCFLTLRGIKTLAVRMQRHCENAKDIANFLMNHPKVTSVNWAGIDNGRDYAIASKQMADFGAMLSFTPDTNSIGTINKILSKVKIFTLAESLGGVESLIGHPASMTHAAIPKANRDKLGITDSLIRLSVGIEDKDDLINDLQIILDF